MMRSHAPRTGRYLALFTALVAVISFLIPAGSIHSAVAAGKKTPGKSAKAPVEEEAPAGAA